jgi:stage V sporulation protein SpoVS
MNPDSVAGSQNADVDPTLLKVRGKDTDKEYVKKLANAVLKTFENHGKASLRCVGAAAVNNADKAIIIASDDAKKRGIELVEKKQFTIANFDGVEKTGILKTIVKNGS